MIKSRRLRWAGHVARIKEGRSVLKILTVNLHGRYLQEGLGVHVGMDLKQCVINTRN